MFTVPIPFSGALQYSGQQEFSFLQHASSISWGHLSQKVIDVLNRTPVLKSNHPFITLADSTYPVWLKNIPHAPPVLFYEGNIDLLQEPMFAIIGSRKCTQQAKNITKQYAKVISAHAVIVSGLAYGVDQIAHLANPSRTIGVCAHGLSAPQTGYRKNLQETILSSGGLLISEFPNDHPIQKWQFVQRNRIVAGLCQWCLMVEAAQKSGSLITAQFAMEFGREVFVIPNHPTVQNALGALELIQQGAQLVSKINDIIESLPSKPSVQNDLLHFLDHPSTITELSDRSNKPMIQILEELQQLQMIGKVECWNTLWIKKEC